LSAIPSQSDHSSVKQEPEQTYEVGGVAVGDAVTGDDTKPSRDITIITPTRIPTTNTRTRIKITRIIGPEPHLRPWFKASIGADGYIIRAVTSRDPLLTPDRSLRLGRCISPESRLSTGPPFPPIFGPVQPYSSPRPRTPESGSPDSLSFVATVYPALIQDHPDSSLITRSPRDDKLLVVENEIRLFIREKLPSPRPAIMSILTYLLLHSSSLLQQPPSR
jgi:hypothetical protein